MNSLKISLSLVAVLCLTLLVSCTEWSPVEISTTTSTTSTSVSTASPVTSKTVTYSTDHGKERPTVKFDITLNADKTITALTANMTSGDHESRQYISRFNSAAKSKIIGKKVTELSLSAIGGASDTTDAFSQVIASL